MLKELLFCKAIQKRKKIKYDFTQTDKIISNLFLLNPWVNLLNKYTKNSYINYNVSNMLKEYSIGNIDVDKNKEKYKIYDDISIYNLEALTLLQKDIDFDNYKKEMQKYKLDQKMDQDYLQNRIITDNTVYDNVDIWFLCFDNKIIVNFLSFYSDKGVFIINGPSKQSNIYLYLSVVFTKFIMEITKNEIIYSIYPFISNNILSYNFNIVGVNNFTKINDNFYNVEYSRQFYKNVSKEELKIIIKTNTN